MTNPSLQEKLNELVFLCMKAVLSHDKEEAQRGLSIVNTAFDNFRMIKEEISKHQPTGVACINLKRKFIGIEKDPKYFQISQERIGKLSI